MKWMRLIQSPNCDAVYTERGFRVWFDVTYTNSVVIRAADADAASERFDQLRRSADDVYLSSLNDASYSGVEICDVMETDDEEDV